MEPLTSESFTMNEVTVQTLMINLITENDTAEAKI